MRANSNSELGRRQQELPFRLHRMADEHEAVNQHLNQFILNVAWRDLGGAGRHERGRPRAGSGVAEQDKEDEDREVEEELSGVSECAGKR